MSGDWRQGRQQTMKGGARLILEATRMLATFKPNKHCVDAFIEEASATLKDVEAAEREFVLDLISGCIEHRKLLDIVVSTFYIHHGTNLLQADRCLFTVVCYLAMFLLEDLGLKGFSKIVKSLNRGKMHKFLCFFFNEKNLTTWMYSQWSQIYDAAFVEKSWIDPLLKWQPAMEGLISQLTHHDDPGNVSKKVYRKSTVPKEFDLTKPKCRVLPKPESIPQQERSHPVPSSTYRTPAEREALDEIKKRNRQKAQKALLDANTQLFHCANIEKSEHTKKVISEILQEQDAQQQFDAVYSSGTPPSNKTEDLPVRLNIAAILREGALYNRQIEEELQRIEKLMGGEGETSSFVQWQRERQEQDLQEELARLERHRLDGLLSHEEAILARSRLAEHNRQQALLQKEETAKLMRRYADKRLREEREMKELVEQVVEGHKNAKAAKVRLQEYKQRIVQEVSEQNRALLQQALDEAQADLCKQFELITEIRALESLHHIKQKFVDDTELAGHGLLGEMSLAELRERLAVLREEQRRDQELKREQHLMEKLNREQMLLDQLEIISLHRAALSQASMHRQKDKEERAQRAVSRDQHVMELKRKLQEKQQERLTLRWKNRQQAQIPTRTTGDAHLSWSHTNVSQKLEEQHWEELERSLERHTNQEALRFRPLTTSSDICSKKSGN